MLTDIEMSIQEWFVDADVNGKVEVAKLYTDIRMEIDKQLEFLLEDKEKQNVLVLPVPCKVGDFIETKYGDTWRVDGFTTYGEEVGVWCEDENEHYERFSQDEIIRYIPKEER